MGHDELVEPESQQGREQEGRHGSRHGSPASGRIRLGVVLPQTRPWQQLGEDFRWAEDVGYDVAYVYDHLTHPTARGEWLADGWVTLAAAAGVTTTLGLGTLVASATLHSPVALARLAGTVQDVSGGRMVLGLGAGSPRCSAADRDEHPTGPELSGRLADVVAGLDAVWQGATQWRGRARSFSGVETLPLPPGARRPPLVLAAHGPRAMALAVRYADGWNTYGGPDAVTLAPEEFWAVLERQVARMDAACAEAGRDRSTQQRSLLLGYGSLLPAASVGDYLAAVERAAVLGFDELVVYAPHSGAGLGSDAAVHARALARVHDRL